MRKDLKESLMLIANDNIVEYKELKGLSTEDFLIKYKIFVDKLEVKQNGR